MAALARALLAACAACAACVVCARAALVRSGPGNALPAPYEGYCHSELRGYKSKITVDLPEILIPAEQESFAIDIPDECGARARELVGGVATACDADAAPALVLAPSAAGAGAVRRRGAAHTNAHCFVKLYCI